MKCPSCSNINFSVGSTCTHCGEELFPRSKPEEQTARHRRTPAEDRLRAAAGTWWKSFWVSLAALSVLMVGSVSTYVYWPVTKPPPAPPSPTSSVESPTPTGNPLGKPSP